MIPRPSGSVRRSSRIRRKQQVRELLARRDWSGFADWLAGDRNPAAVLISLLFVNEELLRWRAIEALGRLVGDKAHEDPEIVRDYLRRLFWSMNDESGNIIWNAPEAIGEILAQVPALAPEYFTQLSAFLREEPFERGTHWAIARLARLHPELCAQGVGELRKSLSDDDPLIRARAARALLAIDRESHRRAVEPLYDDKSPLAEYDRQSGNLQSSTVGQVVKTALAEK
jgi:methylated-DNA-[protein]-cysteine S-methyltransferase